MMTNKNYMGRIFLAPKSVSPPGTSSIYINIGWNTAGGQLYPDYNSEPILQEICSERQYVELKDELESYLSHNSISMCCAMMSMFCLPCTLPCCLILMCCACRVTSGVKRIVDEHGSGRMGSSGAWRHPIRCELKQSGLPVPATEQTMGYDQIGNVLMSTGSNKHPTTKPIWPPLGYNIIVDIADNGDLHARWPRQSGHRLLPKGVNHQQQQQQQQWTASAPPMAHAVVAQDPIVRNFDSNDSRVHPQQHGGPDVAGQLQKLFELKQQGILSEQDYETAKKKVLSA